MLGVGDLVVFSTSGVGSSSGNVVAGLVVSCNVGDLMVSRSRGVVGAGDVVMILGGLVSVGDLASAGVDNQNR